MKRFIVVSLTVLSIVLLASCGTVPKSQDASGASEEGAQTEKNAFDKVYTQAHGKLSEEGAKTYIVQSGDTLTAITKRFYGEDKGYYFPMIMAASSDVVTNPDLIVPGMELSIPDYDANMNNPKIRSALKGVFKDVASIYSKQGKDSMKEHLLEVADSL